MYKQKKAFDWSTSAYTIEAADYLNMRGRIFKYLFRCQVDIVFLIFLGYEYNRITTERLLCD